MPSSRTSRVSCVALVGALTAAAVVGVAAPAAASPFDTPPPQAPVKAAWQLPTGSVVASARSVTGDVPTGKRVRVLRFADVGGKPQLTATDAVGQTGAEQAVREAQAQLGTLAVAVDGIRHLDEKTLGLPATNDTYRPRQWALDKFGAETLWQWSTGKGVIVAVIDSGVANVSDLAGQVLPGIDFVRGYGNGTADANGHGTHVAGIIAAKAYNRTGVAGLAPGVRILPIRVADASGRAYDEDIANGILFAAGHGASVINISIGGSRYSSVLAQAVRYAQSRNIVVVAAAGNERQEGNRPDYPAALPGVLAVAATDSWNQVAYFSNTGTYVKLAAPGVRIASTVPDGYEYMSGTSMAAPYVSAAAALVRSAKRSMSATAVINDLTRTATDIATRGRDNASGSGLVNPQRAVCAVTACIARPRGR